MQQFSKNTKENKNNQLLIDSLKGRINLLQNKINFLQEEPKVKTQLLEFIITSEKSDARNSFQSTTN